jgi:hypothetical protein
LDDLLLDLSVNPIIDQCEAADDPAKDLLGLTVIDPARGSGQVHLRPYLDHGRSAQFA